MKTLLLSTVALAAFAAAPALAQDAVGSVSLGYAHAEADVGPLSLDGDAVGLEANIAIPVTGEWTVVLDSALTLTDSDDPQQDTSTIGGRAHVTRAFGDLRVGAFAGGSQLADETLWSFGASAQKYFERATVTGAVAYGSVEGVDADLWSVGGDFAYFVSPALRLNAGASWSTVDFAGGDTDGWSANLGGEYQIPGTALSLFGGYEHAELKDLDVKADTVKVGLRMSFGGDLRARDRSGADLGRSIGGLAGALGLGL